MSERRLIEEWLPIGALGEESVRERRSMTALPPTYYLHVWWARRPLVASRAAILASLLPADADHEKFIHILGIHGNPAKAKARMVAARKTGEDLGTNPYGYPRAFKWSPDNEDRAWLASFGESVTSAKVLDPTAGGGSIPLEAVRLNLPTFANDLNPVASLLQHATVKWPAIHGNDTLREFNRLAKAFIEKATPKFEGVFPKEPRSEEHTSD